MRMQKLLNTYPFLSEIPDELLSSIDLDVLYIPSPSECQLIHKLSQDLKKNVVVYKKDHICKGGHLCRVLQSASLTPEHLKRQIQVIKTGCTDNCKRGPVIAVMPMNEWHFDVNEVKAMSLLEQPIRN